MFNLVVRFNIFLSKQTLTWNVNKRNIRSIHVYVPGIFEIGKIYMYI